jgi:hypothetical protein
MSQLLEHASPEQVRWDGFDIALSEELQERERLGRLAALFSDVQVFASDGQAEPAPPSTPDNIELGYNRL